MAKAPTMGRRAGTLHVRVIPDTRNFNKRLLAQLKRLEKQLPSMKVQVDDAHIHKAPVRRALQRQLSEIRNLKINVDVDAELKNVSRELEELRQQNKKFDLVPELDKVMLARVVKETEAALKRIEPTITPNIEDDKVRAQVNALARELKKLERDLTISVISPEHAAQIRRRINEIGDELDEMAKDRTVHVDINPFTSWASARLAWLTRPRMVEIIPRVSKAALAKAATAIAALSGARLSFDYMRRFSNWISEVDKKLPGLTFGTVGVTTAFSGLMGTLSGLVGIGDGLAATLPSLLLLPGLLAGAAMSAVSLFVALKDSKEQLAELGDDYTNLGRIIKEAFWGEARQSIINLSNSIMPQLERSFDKTSRAIGRFTAKLMGSFETEFAGGRLEAMFDGLAASWDELAKGTDAFAGAITNLGLVAARYMPRLAEWFVRQADTFDNWLSDVATDGRLDAWIEESIDAFYALWDVMAATTGIFQGIWKAASAAGSGGLRGFADMLLSWEKAVNGAKWQKTLTSMFRGAGKALDGFGAGLERVGEMLYTQSDTIEYFMATAGQSLGGFIGDVADAFARPAFAQGMTDFIDGIAEGLEGLAPALPALSDAFGSLLSFIGELAEVIGPVLAEAFIALAPALTEVLDALTPLLPQLGEAFTDAIRDLAPLVSDLAGVIVDVLPGAIGVISELVRYAPQIAGVAAGVWLATKMFGGMSAVVPGATSAVTGFGNKAVGVGRFLISPWGLATAAAGVALMGLTAVMDDAATSAEEMEIALKQGKNGFEALTEEAEKGFDLGWLYDATNSYENLGAVLDENAGYGNAFSKFLLQNFDDAGAIKGVRTFGDELARIAQTDLGQATSQFQEFGKAAGLNDAQLGHALDLMPQFKLALIDAADAAGLAKDDATLLALALGKIPGASTGAKDALTKDFDAATMAALGLGAGDGFSKSFEEGFNLDGVDLTQFNEKGLEGAYEFWNGAGTDPGNTSLAPWNMPPEFTTDPFGAAGQDSAQAFWAGTGIDPADVSNAPWNKPPVTHPMFFTESGAAAAAAFYNAAGASESGGITPWDGGGLNLDTDKFSQAGSEAKGAFDGGFTALSDTNWVMFKPPALDTEPYSALGTQAGEGFANSLSSAMSAPLTEGALTLPPLDLTAWSEQGTLAGDGLVTAAQTAVEGVDLSATGLAMATSLATGVTSGGEAVTTAVSSMITAATSAVVVDGTSLTAAGTSIVTSFTSGITAGQETAATAATTLGTGVITALDALPAGATTSGKAVADAFAKGITDNQTGAATAGTGLGSAASNALAASATGSYMIGVNFGAGFARGIRSQINAAASAAAAMAAAASSAANANLRVSAPAAPSGGGADAASVSDLMADGIAPAMMFAARQSASADAAEARRATLDASAKQAAVYARATGMQARPTVRGTGVASPGTTTTNVTANFMQPEQREQFRELAAVMERLDR